MKLKLIKPPRPTQKGLTVPTTKGVFTWGGVGDVTELDDQAGHEAIAKWPGCLEEVRKGRPKDSENKAVLSAPENK